MKEIVKLMFGLMLVSNLVSCQQTKRSDKEKTDSLEGTLSLSGAFALYPMTIKWAEEFKKLHPKVRIDISAGGAGKGMADVLSGMVDLAMFSRAVAKAETDQGAWYIAVAKDAVLPTMNSRNPLIENILKIGITQAEFTKIYIDQSIKTWNQLPELKGPETKLTVYTRSDACGAAEMWGKFLGQNQESLGGIGVYGDPGIADAVKNDPNGMGFNNVIYVFDITSRKVFDGLAIIPLDLNQNHQIDADENFYGSLDQVMQAIALGKYPSPPTRDLYFISKGKPVNPLTIRFLQWILTDGQRFVSDAGYVQLSTEKIDSELLKLQ